MSPQHLIALSISERRTVTEYPATAQIACLLIDSLGAVAGDDCSPRDHVGGAGLSGPESAGHYDIWGTTATGDTWRVHVVSADLDATR